MKNNFQGFQMSFLSRLIGNASEIDIEVLQEEFSNVLTDQENIEGAFIPFRDLIVFTSKRLILVDKQGLTGKQREYHSIPYRSIFEFKIITSGHFDIDSELILFTAGTDIPKKIEFKSGNEIVKVQKLLASHI